MKVSALFVYQWQVNMDSSRFSETTRFQVEILSLILVLHTHKLDF